MFVTRSSFKNDLFSILGHHLIRKSIDYLKATSFLPLKQP